MVNEGVTIALFTLSIAIAVGMILKGINIALAILLAYIIYSIPILNINFLESVVQTMNISTLNTLSSLVLTMMLAELYRRLGASEGVIKAFEKINVKVASLAIPMLIGLIPMPGGAYISAVMANPIYSSIHLKPEEKTFINFWFRHVWISVWPLYQAIILSSAILSVNFVEIIKYTWVVALATLFSGLVIVQKMFLKVKPRGRSFGRYRDLVHIWPFIVLAVLSLLTPIPLPLSIILVISILITIYKPSRREIFNALKYAFNPTFIAFILISLMFSTSIRISGLAEILVKYLKSFSIVAIVLLPFTIVIATGFEFTFVVLTFPILKPLLREYNLALAFLGGVIGSMLSPTHPCLILSSQYFSSSLRKVYRYTVTASILSILFAMVILEVVNLAKVVI